MSTVLGTAATQNTPDLPYVQSVNPGSNVTVDNTDPRNPIVSAAGGSGGGTVTNVSTSSDGNVSASVATPTTTPAITLSLPFAGKLAQQTSPDGASLVGFLQSGAQAVGTTVDTQLKTIVTPEQFGALGDYNPSTQTGTNDTSAFAAAITYLETLQNGGILFCESKYKLQTNVSQASGASSINVYPTGAGIQITGNNIEIRGKNKNTSGIYFFGTDGTLMESDWKLVNFGSGNVVWRGCGIGLLGGSTVGTIQTGIIFRDISIIGTSQYTGNNTLPANTTTGDGFDVSNRGICLYPGYYYDDIWIINCEIYNFKGELIYGGGENINHVYIIHNIIHDTNGDGESVSGQVLSTFNEFYTLAASGIEDITTANKPCTWSYNYIHDCLLEGISVGSDSTSPQGRHFICYNKIYRVNDSGIYLAAPINLECSHNYIEDILNNGAFIALVDNPANTPKKVYDVDVFENTGSVRNSNCNAAYSVTNSAYGVVQSSFHDNRAILTPEAITNGISIIQIYTSAVIADATFMVRNNTGEDNNKSSPQITLEYELTTTSSTLVCSRDIWSTFRVRISLTARVTAACTITATLNYLDTTGTVQNVTILSATATGAQIVTSPDIIVAVGKSIQGNYYCQINATCSVANTAFVTCAIEDA